LRSAHFPPDSVCRRRAEKILHECLAQMVHGLVSTGFVVSAAS
jgi:hypothetical protein